MKAPYTCAKCGTQFKAWRKKSKYCSIACYRGESRLPIEHFLKNAIKMESGCWEWSGTRNSGGYGDIRVDCRTTKAHRYSWEIHNGPIPAGMLVCHKCDNPPCVNPSHLFLGTARDNVNDMIKKGRARFWSKRRVRNEQLKSELIALMGTTTCRAAGKKLGIHYTTVFHYWKQLKQEGITMDQR